jgi:menaquinone-specific isochorismate synthase
VQSILKSIGCAYRARPKFDCTLCMSLGVPLVPSERLLRLPGYNHKTFWSPSPEDEFAGVGAAHVLASTGKNRFVQTRDAAQEAFGALVHVGLDGLSVPELKFVGGFSFQPARFDSPLWRGFGDGHFVLPRLAYTRRAQRAWLTLSASASGLSGIEGRMRLARETDAALQALRSEDEDAPSDLHDAVATDGPEEVWSALVNGICGEIAAGRLEKAVAARRVVLRAACMPSAAQVLERLRDAHDSTRFALSVGDLTFLGASPERIVKSSGRRVWTEALAGSVQGDDATHGESLFLSPKDRAEHAIVAREIRALLSPLYESLSIDGPHLHRLRHVSHLRTRFEGILKEPEHVLDLVARLHPTSAVGGAPRIAALAWLAEHEHTERGFYAGPFGAFDREGNGEFVVAIRSGLLGPGEAHLFAGAGIVEGSEVESELCETRWKLQGLMTAMGVT